MRLPLPFLLCLVGAIQTFAAPAEFEKEIAAFEAADRQSPPPKGAILFIGSSSIRLWSTLAADFPEHQVINRGFGGSKIADCTHFAERIIFPYEPRLIVFYAGGNDINAGGTAEQVGSDFREFVAKVKSRLPQTKIACISIAGNPARWAQVEKVRAANALIAATAGQDANVEFIDIFPHMLGSDGSPRPELFVADRLHMSPAGYKIWAELVRPHLADSRSPGQASSGTKIPHYSSCGKRRAGARFGVRS
jgi:lysophospholipase L1-like esterase